MKTCTVAVLAGFLGLLLSAQALASPSGANEFRHKASGHRYVYVPGQFTRDEAWAVAKKMGGYPVVFGSVAEHTRVVKALGFARIAPAHTGHYQIASGREPAGGWMTITGEAGAPLNKLFNSSGPDDGVRKKWGWAVSDQGLELFYGPGKGKNEDCGVIWHDAGGLLEDVSVNHRGGVVVEFNT